MEEDDDRDGDDEDDDGEEEDNDDEVLVGDARLDARAGRRVPAVKMSQSTKGSASRQVAANKGNHGGSSAPM